MGVTRHKFTSCTHPDCITRRASIHEQLKASRALCDSHPSRDEFYGRGLMDEILRERERLGRDPKRADD